MIIRLLMTLIVGAAAGWTLGYLMRDGHPQSRWILVAGLAGAAIAAGARETLGPPGMALALTTAVAGALLASFSTRLSMFAREA
jgi:uncharacterized membrane protein YeaQ/YmgE (transglycosylase-associated protein family)